MRTILFASLLLGCSQGSVHIATSGAQGEDELRLESSQSWYIPNANRNRITANRVGFTLGSNGFGADKDFSLIAASGAKSVRTGIYWAQLEVAKRDYSRLFAELDGLLGLAAANGVELTLQMGVGGPNPLYVTAEESDPVLRCGERGGTSGRQSKLSPHTEEEIAALADFVTKGVEHIAKVQIVDKKYRNVNVRFEIGNEPNGSFFNVCKTTEADHLALADGYKIIARGIARNVRNHRHPNADVQNRVRTAPLFLGGLAAGSWQWYPDAAKKSLEFLQRILSFRFSGSGTDKNLEDLFDGVAFHPYDTYSHGPDNVDGLHPAVADIAAKLIEVADNPENLSQITPEKRMAFIVTEYGYQWRPVCEKLGVDEGSYLACVTEDFKRARWLQRGLAKLLSLNRISSINLFTWRRPDDPGVFGFGMVDNKTLEPSHALKGVTMFMKYLNGTNVGNRIDVGIESVFVHPVRTWSGDHSELTGYLVWTDDRAAETVSFPIEKPGIRAVCIHQYGQAARPVSVQDQSVTLSAGSLMSFVVLDEAICSGKD